jgi:hypothetical protein
MDRSKRELVDKRVGNLSGTSQWVRAAAMPFQRTGSCKAADWMKLLEVAVEYCFAEVIPEQCSDAFWGLIRVLRKLLHATCDISAGEGELDEAAMAELQAPLRILKRECVLALSRADEDSPLTEAAICIHIIMHVPEAIFRWNSVRNFWAFHGERLVNAYLPNQLDLHM